MSTVRMFTAELAIVAGLTMTAAEAQTIYRDRFLSKYPLGSVGIVVEKVQSSAAAKRLLVLPRDETASHSRRRVCAALVAHYDLERKGTETFVGIQLVRMLRAHTTPGTVHVSRNNGWVSRRARQTLGSLDSREVMVPSLADFASKHQNAQSLSTLNLVNGRPLEYEWHAQLTASNELDSANDEHRRFWAKDPIAQDIFASKLKTEFESARYFRTENRLLRFTVTDNPHSQNVPDFTFDCFDPGLIAVAMRVYLPLSTDWEAWYFVNFH